MPEKYPYMFLIKYPVVLGDFYKIIYHHPAVPFPFEVVLIKLLLVIIFLEK